MAAVDYCHLYGASVCVTVNTVILPEEMDAGKSILLVTNEIGVPDRVIVQDLGLARLARQGPFSRLPSNMEATQMTVRTTSKI